MRFRADKPIFQQIVQIVERRIVMGVWLEGHRIPAVRELALELEVNPNTVVKSFSELEERGLIYKERGLGFFVAKRAREKIIEVEKKIFIEKEIPEFFAKAKFLGVTETFIQSNGRKVYEEK